MLYFPGCWSYYEMHNLTFYIIFFTSVFNTHYTDVHEIEDCFPLPKFKKNLIPTKFAGLWPYNDGAKSNLICLFFFYNHCSQRRVSFPVRNQQCYSAPLYSPHLENSNAFTSWNNNCKMEGFSTKLTRHYAILKITYSIVCLLSLRLPRI